MPFYTDLNRDSRAKQDICLSLRDLLNNNSFETNHPGLIFLQEIFLVFRWGSLVGGRKVAIEWSGPTGHFFLVEPLEQCLSDAGS